jgi:trigger factor
VGEIAVKVEEISSIKRKLSFEIPWDDVKQGLEEMYRDVAKKARIRGFRQGKIPRNILELHYKEHVEEETVSKLINRFYWDAVKEHGIRAVAQPEIDQHGIAQDKDFNFTATVEVEPLLEPKNYIDMDLEKEELNVTTQDIEDRLKELQNIFATMQDVGDERTLSAGEFATIDFDGTLDGEALKELKAENYFLEVGSGNMVPGFEDQLPGMKKDERRQIQVRFPDDYHAKHLAGKDVRFNVLLKGIKEKKLPEINEEFVKNFERFDSLEGLKADIYKRLEGEHQARIDADIRKRIIDGMLQNEGNAFDVPPTLIERQVYRMMADMQQRMLARGMDKKMATELAIKMHDSFREEARKIVLSALILKNISRLENIKVTEDEMKERIAAMAQSYGKDIESMQDALDKDDMLEPIENEILQKKVFDFILSKARIRMVSRSRPEAAEAKT